MKRFAFPRSQAEKAPFFTALLMAPEREQLFRDLASRGVLGELFPEIQAMIGVSQPPEFHPEGDVFEHTMLMLRHMVFPDPLLAWSVLLHDVGKPLTRSVESSGRIRFFCHEEKGALLADEILRKMNFPPSEIEVIVGAVRNHMRFAYVREMRKAKVMQIINAPTFALELELHRLDCICCHGKMEGFDFLLQELIGMPLPEEAPLVTGRALLALGVPQGKAVGEMLRQIRKLQLDGRITASGQALEYVKKELRKDKRFR